MDKFVCKILLISLAVIIAPNLSYGGKIRKLKPRTGRYTTVGPELATRIIAPDVLTQEIKKSLSTSAPVSGPLFSSMADEIRRSMQTPPVLSLTLGIKDGAPASFLPQAELHTYLNYALPLAPLATVYQKVQTLQNMVANEENFFKDLVNVYYATHFSMFTPHVVRLHEQIASLRSPKIEKQYLERLETLVTRKEQVAQEFKKRTDSTQLRIRYLEDIDLITTENFNPNNLVLSVEQKMSPSLKRGLFRHLTGETKIRIKHQLYPVYHFKGPMDHLSELYTFLVNGNYLPSRLSLVIDRPRRSIFLYNFDGSVWLRVTPHEYVSVKRLHVHVNKILPFHFMENDKVVEDRILLNLFVPIEAPRHLEGEKIPQLLEDFFFKQPAEQLRELPYVTTVEKR